MFITCFWGWVKKNGIILDYLAFEKNCNSGNSVDKLVWKCQFSFFFWLDPVGYYSPNPFYFSFHDPASRTYYSIDYQIFIIFFFYYLYNIKCYFSLWLKSSLLQGKDLVYALTLENNNGTFEVTPAVIDRRSRFTIMVRNNRLLDFESRPSVHFEVKYWFLKKIENIYATSVRDSFTIIMYFLLKQFI